MTRRTRLKGLVLVLALAACSPTGSATPTPAASASIAADRTSAPSAPVPSTPRASAAVRVVSPSPAMPTPTPSRSTPATPKPTSTARPTPRPSPTSTASTAPPPVTFKPGQIATVTADEGVRMRTKPRVDGGSERYTPILPKGTDLYVISGPKHGSGYHWYQVVPIAFGVDGLVESSRPPGGAYAGWVAVASRDGEAWLGRRKIDCPTKPRDVKALGALSVAQRAGCFSRDPITVRARIVHCSCSITGPCDALRPDWFLVTGEFLELVEPASRAPERDWEHKLPLVFEGGANPHSIPIDKVVTVTGMFNHPAAAKCQANAAEDIGSPGSEPVWVPTGRCRTEFVVTSIK